MRARQQYLGDIEILSDGRTVWVNMAGCSIGRFGPYGIDVHRTIQAQMEGQPECLACTHGPTTLADWRRFQTSMMDHYGVIIPDNHMPATVRQQLAAR